MPAKKVDLNLSSPTPKPAVAQVGIGVSTYTLTLPSNGRKIEIKSMTAREEDILSNPTYIKNGTVFDKLVKAILIEPIDTDTMIVGDRDYILLHARIDAYGKDYDTGITCPRCGKKSKITYDLAEAETKTATVPEQDGVHEFITSRGKRVSFKPWTVGLQKQLEAYMKNTKNASSVTSKLFYQIVSIDGEEDLQALRDIVSNLPAKEALEIRQFINKQTPGIDLTTNFECPECGNEEELEVPLSYGFFWPELD